VTAAKTIHITLVVAAAENGIIGRAGGLPWHIPSDLKTFRRLTLGKPIVMGRKTYEAIGKPLDKRDNVVVTRDADWRPQNDPDQRVIVANSVEAALARAGHLAEKAGADEVAVIGGADIYRQALAYATRVYLTLVHARPDGDATFPSLDPAQWTEVSRIPGERQAADVYDWTLTVWERRS
jgi:dihydrofolate reductase